MGMKLKSGADLCGFQLTNFCVQGEASAPSDAALGRKYFHTNATDDVATGISLLNRERIYLGEGAWRATAYLDDIAAINEKLNLITGDTDTDTLINNLKDLEEFLKDFSETDKLKSLLDGKLSTSGGTLSKASQNVLNIDNSSGTAGKNVYLRFFFGTTEKARVGYNDESGIGAYIYNPTSTSYIGVKDDGTPHYNKNTLIHSGNIGSQNVTSAKRLHTSTNAYMVYESRTGNLMVGDNIYPSGDTHILGNNIRMRYGASASYGLILNSSGNVTIGASDLAGTTYKLYVNGGIYVGKNNEGIYIARYGNTIDSFSPSGDSLALNINHTSQGNIIMANGGGKVIIGTTDDNSKGKLQVKGDLYVDGNIISTKEVSAGGAGAEEGTSGSGSAEGVSEVFTPTSTSMAFDHNLGEDVIVQVYEKSGNVWNMVIVDTEITSATRVTLRFGKTETTQHKVVIMGV